MAGDIGAISAISRYPYFRPRTHQGLHTYVALFDPLNITGKWSERLWPSRVETYVERSLMSCGKERGVGSS